MCNCGDCSNQQTVRIVIGGCGCGSNQVPPPTGDDLPPTPIPPIPTPDDDIGLLWKCNMANYSAYLWRLWGIYVTGNQTTNTMSQIENAYLNLGLTSPSYASRWLHVTTAVLNMGGNEGLPYVFDPAYEQIVCSIYRAPTAAAAADNLRLIAATNLASWGGGMKWLIDMLPLQATFTPQATFANLPPGYRERDCSGCTTPVPPTTGAWYFVPGIIATPYPTVTGTGTDDFTLSGVAKAGSVTDISLGSQLEGYENESAYGALTAVAFTIVDQVCTPAMPGDGGSQWVYGAVNKTTIITDVSGQTVLIWLTGHPQPDAGSFDVVREVTDVHYLKPNFGFYIYEYTPADRTITLEISDFELRTT